MTTCKCGCDVSTQQYLPVGAQPRGAQLPASEPPRSSPQAHPGSAGAARAPLVPWLPSPEAAQPRLWDVWPYATKERVNQSMS